MTPEGMDDLLGNWNPDEHGGMPRCVLCLLVRWPGALQRRRLGLVASHQHSADIVTSRSPRLLYTIPVCQNPTGATMSLERKKRIYEIAVKYDVIIVEDDRESATLRSAQTAKGLCTAFGSTC